MYFYLQSVPVLLSPNNDQNQPKVEQEVVKLPETKFEPEFYFRFFLTTSSFSPLG